MKQGELFDSRKPRKRRPGKPVPLGRGEFTELELRGIHRAQRGEKIQTAFHRWLRKNPTFFPLIRRFALEAFGTGRKHYGIAYIIERVRWHIDIETKGDPFKINNNFRSRITRKLEQEFPGMKGFFKTRRLQRQ